MYLENRKLQLSKSLVINTGQNNRLIDGLPLLPGTQHQGIRHQIVNRPEISLAVAVYGSERSFCYDGRYAAGAFITYPFDTILRKARLSFFA